MQKMVVLLAAVFLLSGCTTQVENAPEGASAKQACVSACQKALQEKRDLSTGPCLLGPIPGTDWACDVAHAPREPVDNDPANQCQSFRSGQSKHFVEVNPACNFIREA